MNNMRVAAVYAEEMLKLFGRAESR